MKRSDKTCKLIDDELTILADAIYHTGDKMFGSVSNTRAEQRRGPSRTNRKLATLRKEKRKLRRDWETADGRLKEDLKIQREDVLRRIRKEARKERKHARRKVKRDSKQQFFKNPYKFAKSLFEESRSGTLECSQQELEDALHSTYSDPLREMPLDHMNGIPRPTEPGIAFNLGELTMYEMRSFVKKARAKSSQGQDGVPYKVYKRCPKLVKWLFLILKKAWENKFISKRWARKEGIYIPKEADAKSISQFRPIALGNTDGKIFLGILAKRVRNFLIGNQFIDETVQKTCIPGSPGCIERSAMIWDEIQIARKESLI